MRAAPSPGTASAAGSTASAAPPLSAVEVVSPAPRAAWQRAYDSDPTAFPTQAPAWLDALSAARGAVDASRLYRLPDGRELVLPLAGRSWGGVRVAEESWPYGWGYGGLLTAGGEVSVADARLVLADLARRPVARAAVVPVPLTADVWSEAAPASARRVSYLTQVVGLDGGFGTVWADRYKKSTRNLVRRAGREGLEVRREHGGTVLTTFAEMYRRSTDRWAGRRGQPLAAARLWSRYQDRAGQVAAVASTMGESCVIWSARRDGETAAVLVVLQHGQHALSWLTAIDREISDQTLATYLLQSLAIEDACRLGARWFHLGETDPGSGVELYKRKFGALPVPYDALRLERVPITGVEQRLRRTARAVSERRRADPGSPAAPVSAPVPAPAPEAQQ